MRIVISAVNLIDGGALEILKKFLKSADEISLESNIQFTFLLANRSVSEGYSKQHNYIYFPNAKKRWINRLIFEFNTSYSLSKKLKPDLWISLHDISPHVVCKQVVYCHNPSPFLNMPLKDIFIDWKQFLFSKLYLYLYRININKNIFVVVQQHWIKKSFQNFFPKAKIIVSKPINKELTPTFSKCTETSKKMSGPFTVFYPAYPRYFKNQKVIIEAARLLEKENIEFLLTIDGTENRYAKKIVESAKNLTNVKFLGLLTKKEVDNYYRETDALVFPSLLETWGLPITEFAIYNKPIILANLDYAKETSAGLGKLFFFEPTSSKELANSILQARNGASGEFSSDLVKTEKSVDGTKELLYLLIEYLRGSHNES